MSYEKRIQKELDKHDQQWEDAVCPNVARFGRQADKEIARLNNLLNKKEHLDVSCIGMIS